MAKDSKKKSDQANARAEELKTLTANLEAAQTVENDARTEYYKAVNERTAAQAAIDALNEAEREETDEWHRIPVKVLFNVDTETNGGFMRERTQGIISYGEYLSMKDNLAEDGKTPAIELLDKEPENPALSK